MFWGVQNLAIDADDADADTGPMSRTADEQMSRSVDKKLMLILAVKTFSSIERDETVFSILAMFYVPRRGSCSRIICL